MPEPEEIDWNECVPWTGEERDLPVGEQTRIPDFRAMDLVRRWEVLDTESDEGFKVVKKEELKPSDKIIGAQINEKAVDKIVQTYGKRFIVFARADGVGPLLDRWEWYAMTANAAGIGADVLELEALKQIRQKR
jgi:hypothetical protein